MAENVIYVRGTKQSVREAVYRAASAAAGKTSEGREAADALQVRLGMVALARIRDAFVVKSKGGTDDCGLKWPPLSKKTIAYSRRHPGVPPSSQRAAFRPSYMLTDAQRVKWWKLYSKALAMFAGDKNRSAAYAWKIIKAEGGKTLIGTYGDTAVLILRDTGLLLNSLSPGVVGGRATPENIENQVFRVGQGEVIIGTNRKGAAAQHNGIPGRLPQRRLWAEPSQWPAEWWKDIQEQAVIGYIEILTHFLKAA